MKKYFFLFISLCFANVLLAQEYNGIKIVNLLTQKEVVVNEYKNIIVKTIDGKKISGKFSILDNAIAINNEKIEITDILYLKRNPVLIAALTSGVLIYSGALIGGVAIVMGVLSDSTTLWFLLPSAGMIYAGIKPPNFFKKYKTTDHWQFELITIED